jgi:hypothetical protein
MDLDDFLTPDFPEPKAPCGCPEWDCTPAVHEGRHYCQSCDGDLPEDQGAA